jgi:hypothetical protein
MDISRELAIIILRYLDEHPDFYFPFLVMNKEYSEEDDDFVEIEPNEWETIEADSNYKTFQLWENLQTIDLVTTRLLVKGFVERITGQSIESRVKELAENYRAEWKVELWESENIEEYGLNEYLGGKADAYEECAELMMEYKK